MLITGKQFNEIYKNIKFVKFTDKTEKHDDFEFKTGMNMHETHNYSDRIDFAELTKSYKILWNLGIHVAYARYVTIPDDAEVEIDNFNNVFKADKLILSERIRIEDLEVWDDLEYIVLAIIENAFSLSFIKNQTEELCLVAVRRRGIVLQFVKNQTDKICLAAVKQDGTALAYVLNQTDEICLVAVTKYGFSLLCVKKQTDEICLAAVKENFHVLKYVENQTPEICLEALKRDAEAIKYIRYKDKIISQLGCEFFY
jgi:hypothetical protein